MSSFLRPASTVATSRSLGWFEVIGQLANTGIAAYLEKERQRRADLEARRAAALELQRQQSVAARDLEELGFASQVQSAATSPTGLLAIGASGLVLAWLLLGRRRK